MFAIGAWDFDEYARSRKKLGLTSLPTDNCNENDLVRSLVSNRTSNATISTLMEISAVAKAHGTQLIYRNNYFNERFSAVCADAGVEAALLGSAWEVFNNRDISKDVWQLQCPDGFHFARENIYSVEDHRKYAAERYAKDGVYPGQLEMQLAQTLLFQIFHSVLDSI